MIVGKAIYYLLTNATDVTDIVSTRIYPEVAQQDSDLPFIVYNVTNNEPSDTKPEPSKLDTAQVEVNIYSDSYTEAIDLAVAVRAALDRVKGTYNGVNVQSIQYQNEVIDFDEPQRAYNISADYDVRISRSGFEIAQGSPITGVQLGELSDVDVTGVSNGQLIAYNESTGNWEAANDAGGANELSDLNDANVSLPSDGEVLIYSGGEFVNDNVAISNVTGLQAALDAAPDNLRELTDVTISGLADNDYLQYNSATGVWENSALIVGRNGEQYTGNYDSEAETLLDGATDTVELYYTAQADGDGLHEDAQSDTATTGFDIRRKLYYAEKAQADPDTSGDWTQFADIADDTTYANAKATLLAYLKARTGGTVPISLKMTWEEVAQAPAFTGLLNETYGSGAAAAYSVRRLNGNYTGAAIQVERSSDNTTQDIGFDVDGNLDESALTTFCTGTVCKVRTWYDQSVTGGTGSGNDAQQTDHSKQPTIYTGGAIVKENGRVAVDFDGADDFLDLTGLAVSASDYAFFSVNKLDTATTYFLFDSGGGRLIIDGRGSGTFGAYYDGSWKGTRHSGTTQQLQSFSLVSPSSSETYISGKQINTGGSYNQTALAGTTTLGVDYSTQTIHFDGTMQEFLVYSSNKSTDRTDIEENIGDYFTQNTPLLDTYTGAAAAYSLRKLSSSYSGSAIRVRRASDNTESDIGFNVFGELSTVELAAFCGSSDGFVKTWYCQSGNANDATQSTTANQPKIYDGTTGVVTENGKPAVQFDGVNDYFTPSMTIAASNYSLHAVTKDTSNDMFLFDAQSGRFVFDGRGGSRGIYFDGSWKGTSHSGTSQQLQSIYAIAPSSGQSYVDGAQINTGLSYTQTAIGGSIALGASFGGGDHHIAGIIQEFILYASDESSNRTNIEDNINTFYSIY